MYAKGEREGVYESLCAQLGLSAAVREFQSLLFVDRNIFLRALWRCFFLYPKWVATKKYSMVAMALRESEEQLSLIL